MAREIFCIIFYRYRVLYGTLAFLNGIHLKVSQLIMCFIQLEYFLNLVFAAKLISLSTFLS